MGSGGKGKRGRGEQVETVLLPVIKISALSAGEAAGGLGLKPGDQRQYLTEPSTKAAENLGGEPNAGNGSLTKQTFYPPVRF